MISTGAELLTFITSLNGDAALDPDLAETLVETAKAIIEEERPWMVLRKTDTSKSIATSNAWNTAIDLSTITDFSRFYGDEPIIIFNSGSNLREYLHQVPFDRRLEYKDVSGTFCFDENSKTLYINGVVSHSGTLYINYICSSPDIDLTAATAIWSLFPTRYLPLLGYYAVGIYKGAIDYDSINKLMLPENREVMNALKNALEKWDNERQLSAYENNDPTERGVYPRSGAVNRYNEY